MELFPKNENDIFKRRVFVTSSEYDMLETPSMKWRLSHWEKATKDRKHNDNETALDREMGQTLTQVHDFLKRLEIMVTVHSKRTKKITPSWDWTKSQALESRLKDQVVLGHTLMAKVKELLELEDSGRRLSSCTTQSSASGLGISMIDSYDCDSISQSSRYSSELRGLLRRFNLVLRNKERRLPPQVQELEIAAELKESVLVDSKRDSLQFLTERLATDNVQPVFSSLPAKPNESSHTVSCKLFNITVEGKASEKSAAKRSAANKMLERLVNDCQLKKIPPQITPFTNFEMREAVGILCEARSYDEELAQLCKERRKELPRYETDNSKQSLRVHCSALGLQATGSYPNIVTAKRAAARELLRQFQQRPKY